MLEMLQDLADWLLEQEGRADTRCKHKQELGNTQEASKQEGKFIAYRRVRERVEELIAELSENADEYDEPYDPYSECGYDPYTGGYDMDL